MNEKFLPLQKGLSVFPALTGNGRRKATVASFMDTQESFTLSLRQVS